MLGHLWWESPLLPLQGTVPHKHSTAPKDLWDPLLEVFASFPTKVTPVLPIRSSWGPAGTRGWGPNVSPERHVTGCVFFSRTPEMNALLTLAWFLVCSKCWPHDL